MLLFGHLEQINKQIFQILDKDSELPKIIRGVHGVVEAAGMGGGV